MILSEADIKAICSKKPNSRFDNELKTLEKGLKPLIKLLNLQKFDYIQGRKENWEFVLWELKYLQVEEGKLELDIWGAMVLRGKVKSVLLDR